MPIITVPAERPPVALRRMCVDDVPMLLALESDPEVMRYSTGVKPATEARRRELLDWLRGRPASSATGPWWPTATRSAGPANAIAGTDRIQLAYRLQRRAWGRGCATAAGRQLCDYAWRMLDVAALSAVAWPDNLASRRVLEKLGFVQAGTETHYGRDTVAYLLPRPASA